jgi:tetratricopeptide (TPR) repeat protein
VAEAIERLDARELEAHYESLAYHYERSQADEKAIEYLLKAGEKARRSYLNEAATGYFQRALARLDGLERTIAHQQQELEALRGLALVYHLTGKRSEAEPCFRKAITLARDLGRAEEERARLYFWLGQTLWFEGRYDEVIRNGETALAEFGGDRESLAVALMLTNCLAYRWTGDMARWYQSALRLAEFLQRLPFCQELGMAYAHVAGCLHVHFRQREESLRWLDALEEHGRAHHDLVAQSWASQHRASCLMTGGDLKAGIRSKERALQLSIRAGDLANACDHLGSLACAHLFLGDLRQAEQYLGQLRHLPSETNRDTPMTRPHLIEAVLSLARNDLDSAWQTLQAGRSRNEGTATLPCWVAYLRGRIALAQDRQAEAGRQFREALSQVGIGTPFAMGRRVSNSPPLRYRARPPLDSMPYRARTPDFITAVILLAGLEEVLDTEEFRGLCRQWQEMGPLPGNPAFKGWFLEPAQGITDRPWRSVNWWREVALDPHVANDTPQANGWVWRDPFEDCSFTVDEGLTIYAAHPRDLWGLNVSAPRWMRPIQNAFVVQTVCRPPLPDRPGIGGLLLWKDRESFLRLDRGRAGPHEIWFHGAIDGDDVILGRGRLPTECITLRLERNGEQVGAFCSGDGENWFTVGQAHFPVLDPLEIGLHAAGWIDRTLYHGAYPEGTAMRFERFGLWVSAEETGR